jgi:hypothetical protein
MSFVTIQKQFQRGTHVRVLKFQIGRETYHQIRDQLLEIYILVQWGGELHIKKARYKDKSITSELRIQRHEVYIIRLLL